MDISSVWLEQIKKTSGDIDTLCNDIYTYDVSDYDFILLDSMLHFYKKDIEKEKTLAKRILAEMKGGSVLVNNMMKSAGAEKQVADIYDSFGEGIALLENKYIDYPDFNSTYHLTAYKKK